MLLQIAIILFATIDFIDNLNSSAVQNDTGISPIGQQDYQSRAGNTRSNSFLDFRVRTDNHGSFLSFLNNDYPSNIPEGVLPEIAAKETFPASSLTVLNNIKREINEIGNDLLITSKNDRSCHCDNRTSVSSRSTFGVYYDQSFEDVRAVVSNNSILPKDCNEILKNGVNKTGIYKIQPVPSAKAFMVLCDMEIRGGGWTHIHKRFDGSQDFHLGWREYKFGFGDLENEFWLGLRNIHLLTKYGETELLVEIEDRDGLKAYAHYTFFEVGPEPDCYPLKVLKGFSGDAGNSLENHLGSKFTTRDFDQDESPSNCAELYFGGWWYKNCHLANLNGKFLNINLPKAYEFKGIHWAGFRGHPYSHAKARMLVKIK